MFCRTKCKSKNLSNNIPAFRENRLKILIFRKTEKDNRIKSISKEVAFVKDELQVLRFYQTLTLILPITTEIFGS